MENYTCVLVTPFPSCFSETFEKPLPIRVKVCIIRLDHICLKNLRRLFDMYAVARTEHDTLVKSTTKILLKFRGLLRKHKL